MPVFFKRNMISAACNIPDNGKIDSLLGNCAV